MKPYFLPVDNYPAFINAFENMDSRKNSSILLDIKDEQIAFDTVVDNEMLIFQQNKTMQLTQRAITIEWHEKGTSLQVLEECTRRIIEKYSYWHIIGIPLDSRKNHCSILNVLSQTQILKIAFKNRLIKYPSIVRIIDILSLITGVSAVCLAFLFLRIPFSTTSASIIAGSGIAFCTLISFLSRKVYFKKYDISEVIGILSGSSGSGKYDSIVADTAAAMMDKVPAAIIIEDLSRLDSITKDVIEYILYSGKSNVIGSLLWVVFHAKSTNTEELFRKGAIPVKRFSVKTGINLIDD